MNRPTGVPGMDAVRKKLEDMQERVSEAVAAALEEAAQLVAESARQKCPRDSGSLAASIQATGVMTSPQGGTVRVVAAAPHADFVEYGTANSPAQPFLYPALAENQDAIRSLVASAVKEAMRS